MSYISVVLTQQLSECITKTNNQTYIISSFIQDLM